MKEFIKDICQKGEVYLLTSDQGFAISHSNFFEYEDGSNLEVICFWSDPDLANKAKHEIWANHSVEPIKINIFLEEWLFGMVEEVSLVGINFDDTLKGEEQTPIDVILSIIHELKITNNFVKLNHFKDLEEIKRLALELKESLNL